MIYDINILEWTQAAIKKAVALLEIAYNGEWEEVSYRLLCSSIEKACYDYDNEEVWLEDVAGQIFKESNGRIVMRIECKGCNREGFITSPLFSIDYQAVQEKRQDRVEYCNGCHECHQERR